MAYFEVEANKGLFVIMFHFETGELKCSDYGSLFGRGGAMWIRFLITVHFEEERGSVSEKGIRVCF